MICVTLLFCDRKIGRYLVDGNPSTRLRVFSPRGGEKRKRRSREGTPVSSGRELRSGGGTILIEDRDDAAAARTALREKSYVDISEEFVDLFFYPINFIHGGRCDHEDFTLHYLPPFFMGLR